MAAENRVRRTADARESRNGQSRYTTAYIDGNVVRHIQTAPQRERQERADTRERRSRQTSVKTRANREKALQMNRPYVIFLTAASVATVALCVNYLQLQAQGTTYRSTIASLESKLNTLRLANDTAYDNAVSSVNLEEVKSIAVNEFDMDYAEEGQVILYSSQEEDFIRQYEEIPAE